MKQRDNLFILGYSKYLSLIALTVSQKTVSTMVIINQDMLTQENIHSPKRENE